MPPIDKTFIDHVLLFSELNTTYPIFIETGTCTGSTIFSVEPYFIELYTIEIQKTLQDRAKNMYKGSKINFINGSSEVELKKIVPLITDNAIFFLDAHYSGGETGRSDKDCPLYEEIIDIANNFKNKAILIIDDFRLFGTNINEDWSEISKDKICKILDTRILKVYHLPSIYHEQDRLIIHIDKI